MRSNGVAVAAIALGLIGCGSDGESGNAGSTEIASGTTDGYDWSAVVADDEGNTCVGFEVDGEPMGRTCGDAARLDEASVVEYVGVVTQGMDRVGFAFLGSDQADEATVTFDDGSQTRQRFEASADLPSDATAVAFLGPQSSQPVRITVTSVDGQPLLDYDIPPLRRRIGSPYLPICRGVMGQCEEAMEREAVSDDVVRRVVATGTCPRCHHPLKDHSPSCSTADCEREWDGVIGINT